MLFDPRQHYAVLDWSSASDASPELIVGATRDDVDRQLIRSIRSMHEALPDGLLEDGVLTAHPFPDPDDLTRDVSTWVEKVTDYGPLLIARFDDSTLTWAPSPAAVFHRKRLS
ncbi:hypothetical protein QEZ54_08545 [Catellatospora sp. KI3]|uniref:hypothetical protein n=1 Tax=Catellatospora sp. KI3 TaxID=3041620 RepID=UPI00248287EE|nr:hypothetical protein [Catellatospora sp. KI3]MDI1461010.1 hypothetical protein [Catellatospora sp. KI3]